MKVQFSVATGFVGSRATDTFDVEKDLLIQLNGRGFDEPSLQEEIDEAFKEWLWQTIDANFTEIK